MQNTLLRRVNIADIVVFGISENDHYQDKTILAEALRELERSTGVICF